MASKRGDRPALASAATARSSPAGRPPVMIADVRATVSHPAQQFGAAE